MLNSKLAVVFVVIECGNLELKVFVSHEILSCI